MNFHVEQANTTSTKLIFLNYALIRPTIMGKKVGACDVKKTYVWAVFRGIFLGMETTVFSTPNVNLQVALEREFAPKKLKLQVQQVAKSHSKTEIIAYWIFFASSLASCSLLFRSYLVRCREGFFFCTLDLRLEDFLFTFSVAFPVEFNSIKLNLSIIFN